MTCRQAISKIGVPFAFALCADIELPKEQGIVLVDCAEQSTFCTESPRRAFFTLGLKRRRAEGVKSLECIELHCRSLTNRFRSFSYHNQIVLQFEGEVSTGTEELGKDDLAHRYLWGPGTDQLLADEAIESLTDASQNETLWALTDHLGTVRDLVDSSGQVRKHTSYNGFGQVTGEQHYDSNGTAISDSHAAAVDQLKHSMKRPVCRIIGIVGTMHL